MTANYHIYEENGRVHSPPLRSTLPRRTCDKAARHRPNLKAAKAVRMTVTRAINQGDIYWIQPEHIQEAEPGDYPHPYIVIQDNVFNHSRIHTVIVCALTSNLKQAHAPGNVLLEAGEANLPRQSVVVVSKVSTVPKAQLGEYIGSLNAQRIAQVLAGMRFLQSSFFAE